MGGTAPVGVVVIRNCLYGNIGKRVVVVQRRLGDVATRDEVAVIARCQTEDLVIKENLQRQLVFNLLMVLELIDGI